VAAAQTDAVDSFSLLYWHVRHEQDEHTAPHSGLVQQLMEERKIVTRDTTLSDHRTSYLALTVAAGVSSAVSLTVPSSERTAGTHDIQGLDQIAVVRGYRVRGDKDAPFPEFFRATPPSGVYKHQPADTLLTLLSSSTSHLSTGCGQISAGCCIIEHHPCFIERRRALAVFKTDCLY
jgi:hypothetical protein